MKADTLKNSKSIMFDFDAMRWRGISIEQIKFWEEVFPDVDVLYMLSKRMPAWLDANPKRAKKKNWKQFIVNWLASQQDRYDNFKRG
jgi:hypothetical protein